MSTSDFQAQLEIEAQAEPPNNYALPPKLNSKKILITSESLGPINGVTRATQYLLDFLLERDVKLAAVAPDFGKQDISPLRKRMPIVRLPGLPIIYNPDLVMPFPFRVQKIYERTFKPDLIYLASPASLGLQFWLQVRNSGIPLIANFQTDLSAYAKRMLPKPLQTPTAWLFDELQKQAFAHKSFKYILCPSSASRDYLLSLKVPPKKLKIVGRGVDCHFFDHRKRSAEVRAKLAPNNEILLLCVSRISLEKGFDFLAEAYRQITLRLESLNLPRKVRLIITGGNSNQNIERNIHGYFSKYHLDVIFTGAKTGEPLAQIFAGADIFVYPSVTETFGQVIQEAMASGLPVVARREGGPTDIVQPGLTGYLPDPNDLAAFVENTLELIQNEELRQRMSRAARTYAENRTWDAINYEITQIMADSLN
jgi:glycosyltransferase involved in cell wall biosynthesis